MRISDWSSDVCASDLGAEDVRVARAAAWAQAVYGELDGEARIVLDEIGDALIRDVEQLSHGGAGQRLAPLHRLVNLCRAEDDVEGDLVHAGILGADGLGQLGELLSRHVVLLQRPASVMWVGKSCNPSFTARVGLRVPR